jgi:ATP-binding cassette subfamily C (CFTR/MRP) protein 1
MPKTLIPTLAAVLSFVTYSLTGHELTVATIFASLQLFNIVQAPMTQLPMVITALSDNHIAIQRISKILTAEEKPHGLLIDPTAEYAVTVTGDFSYETASPPDQLANDRSNLDRKAAKAEKKKAIAESEKVNFGATNENEDISSPPFMLKNIDLRIPRGSLVCIFGRIGAGKSALLEGLLGEMRQTQGSVSFGGCLSLVTQTPWIQSASLKNNILFGKQLDVGRLRETIHACALTRDIEQLDDGLHTEIGGQ